ncbi:ABC transporter ATP-binding protein [Taklimakanibacter deserti]|uniref:ABC transporter ATP-binding protein n=1 Tax=Taklimakanibacter deserti TaxID=2267839 RepID=UPI000E655C0A
MTEKNRDIITLAGVSKVYGPVEVLKPIDLAVKDGEFLTLLGPSGSGKTTILRLIGGFTPPSGGRILLDGEDISRLPIFARPLNTVFQDYALFPHMTVAQNVGFGLRVRKRPKAEVARRVAEVLSVVGLTDKARRFPSDLSGGQRQRVALARAIICAPRLILLDEPLAALDAELRRSMQVFLKDLQRQIRTTFIFVTHDQEEAIAVSDRIAVMNQGRIEQIGTPEDVYYRPHSEFVARFFGENNVLAAALDDGAVRSILGRHAVARPPALGATLHVAIRPERLSLAGRSGAPGHDSLSAIVEKRTFLGPVTELILRPEGAPEALKLRLADGSLAALPAIGEKVTLAWSRSDISLLAS